MEDGSASGEGGCGEEGGEGVADILSEAEGGEVQCVGAGAGAL